jgi:hypothetical protein
VQALRPRQLLLQTDCLQTVRAEVLQTGVPQPEVLQTGVLRTQVLQARLLRTKVLQTGLRAEVLPADGLQAGGLQTGLLQKVFLQLPLPDGRHAHQVVLAQGVQQLLPQMSGVQKVCNRRAARRSSRSPASG